jgi:hypothetical protein
MTGVVEVLAAVGSAAASAASAVAPVVSTIAPFAAVAGSLASAGLQVSGARQQSQALTIQAQQQQQTAAVQDQVAQQEALRGQEAANQVRENLFRTLASQRAQYAAAGLVLEGTPQDVADQTVAQADRELQIQAGDTAVRVASARQTAANSRTSATLLTDRAGSTMSSAGLAAGISLFDAVDRFGRRMPGTVAERTGVTGPGKTI